MEVLTIALKMFKGLSLDYQLALIIFLIAPFIAMACKSERR